MKVLITSALIFSSIFAQSQQLFCGESHSFMICDNGELRAFGNNGWGQLGTGDFNHQSIPVIVDGIPPVIQVAGGGFHSLAITENGQIYVWGANDYGQAGTGEVNQYYLNPVLVNDIDNVIQVGAGKYISVALKADGTVWTWGRNDSGTLGNGNYDNSNVPVQVLGLSDVIQIGVGSWHVFALTADGSVYAWGQNNFAVLGLGSDFPPTYNTPQSVNIEDVVKIDAGYNHSIALKEDGTVWVWGNDSFGQLGQGAAGFANAPIIVPALENIVDIESGNSHMQALDNQGNVFTWGYNDYGQVGNGNLNDSNTPSIPIGLENVTTISCGDFHSLCINSNGDLIGYGRNDAGQLGTGNIEDSSVPVIGVNDCETIGLSEPIDDQMLNLFPNPADSKIFLTIHSDYSRDSYYRIYSNTGQLIASEIIGNKEGLLEIDLNQLPAGIFLLQVNNGVKSITESFIKQ